LNISYTQAPTSKDEVTIRRAGEKKVPVVEVPHEAFPQPFLNPSIIQERIEADKRWKTAQQRMKEPEAVSSSSQAP